MTTLQETLKQFSEDFKLKAPAEAQDLMQKALDDLSATSIIEGAHKTGDTIPEISLPNISGELVSLQEMLKQGPLIVLFYRGGWCPYCNLELQAWQDVASRVSEKGARIVAISPETPDHIQATAEKHSLSFEVLSDKDNIIAKQMGLVYTLPEELIGLYKQFGIDLEEGQGNQNSELPIAATYIVNTDGTISYDFLEEDYKLRAEPQTVIDKL